VTIDVKTRGDGCVVRIQEEAIAGPGRFIPQQLLDIPLHWRNDEALHRLAYLAEGRAAGRLEATTAEKEMADTGEEHHTDAGARAATAASASADPADAAKLQGDELADAVSGTGGTEGAMSTNATEPEPAPVTSTDGVEQADATGQPLDLEDSWNPLAGAGESEPLAPDTPKPGESAADAASDPAPKPSRSGAKPTGAKTAGAKPAGAKPTAGTPTGDPPVASESAGTEAPSP
jgi:hypothetical protein